MTCIKTPTIGDTLKIVIKSCNDSSKWYARRIGMQFDVIAEEQTEYKVREPADNEFSYPFLNFVSKQDAIIVK